MKRVLVGLATIVVVVLGSNYYYLTQVEKHLDTAARTIRAMGGDLEYTDVSITLGGDVQVDKLRLVLPGLKESMIVDRIALHTGSIFGVHQLAMDLRKSRLPERLGFSLEDAYLPVGGEAYRQSNLLALEPIEHLLTAGCGDRTALSEKDLANMGYGDLVTADSEQEYRIMNNGQWIEVESKSTIEGMNEFVVKVDFSLNATSRDLNAIGAAVANIQLGKMSVEYQDKGYLQRLVDFCQKESGLPRAEYLTQHLEAWEQTWENYGFTAGDNLVTAYRQLMENPGQFRIDTRPIDYFGLQELTNTSPELLPYRFLTDLEINGTAAGRLDLTLTEAAEETSPENSPAAHATPQMLPTTKGQRRGTTTRTAIAVDELRHQLNQQVELRLNSGRTLSGRVVQVNDDGLQVHSYQPTGSMTIPVTYAQIEEAYLKSQL